MTDRPYPLDHLYRRFSRPSREQGLPYELASGGPTGFGVDVRTPEREVGSERVEYGPYVPAD